MVYASAAPPPPVEELSEDFAWEPLGPTEFVRNKLSSAIPEIDWSDPTWGDLDENGYSIEFNIGEDEPCDSVMLHIRGSDGGNFLQNRLRNICEKTGWYILVGDEWFHQSIDPMKKFREFTVYRDKLIGELGAKPVKPNAKPFWKRWFRL